MKIEKVEVFPTRLPFKAVFKISRGAVGSLEEGAPHIYVRLTADDGSQGWGEARPSPRWSYETEETVISTIENYLAPAIQGLDPWDLEALHQNMDTVIAPANTIGQPIAKSAIDMACHDLICKRARIPLVSYFGSGSSKSFPLSYMVSADSPQEAERLAAEGREKGYKGFKVKLGLSPDKDLDILRAVKSGGGEDAFLWADPNQAYDLTIALQLARKMEALGGDVLEQPISANDLTGLARLCRSTDLPIAVDESVFAPRDLLQIIKLGAADCVVLKVSKCGGLRACHRMAELALDAGMRLLGSNLTESMLGFSASAHLFAACGISAPVDLNGPQFLAEDPVRSTATALSGNAHISGEPGHGAEVVMSRLGKYLLPRRQNQGNE